MKTHLRTDFGFMDGFNYRQQTYSDSISYFLFQKKEKHFSFGKMAQFLLKN